jgi:cell division inhibitor SepF
MVYLGLADDDELDYLDYEEPEVPRPAPEQGPVIRPVADAPRTGVVRTLPTTAPRVHIVEPKGFNDAQEVGERLRGNQPVILNLQGLDRDLQRRLIDFTSGLAFGIDGHMRRVADQVFLVTPSNVEISQEEKERLQARGLYQRDVHQRGG